MKRKASVVVGVVGTVLLGVSLFTPVAGGPAPSVAQEVIALELQAPAYELRPAEDGSTVIEAEGCGLLGEEGQPLLPHQRVDVALPPDVAWESLTLEVRDVQAEVLPGGPYRLPTAVGLWPCNQPAPTPAPGAATAAEPLPVARIAHTGQMRKWRVARLDFSPFQYDSATGQLRVVKRATVELRFACTGRGVSAQALADDVLDDVAAEQFVNFKAARAWYPRAVRPQAVTYDYVIITTNAIVENSAKLGAFVAHQQGRGYSVRVVTEDDYGSGTNDRPELVREWLRASYASGIKYVLLIGDPRQSAGNSYERLPMKVCFESFPDRPGFGSHESFTDYYYADLSNTWDKDGDGLYGEFYGDYSDVSEGIDLFPEVYVGRIPVYGSYQDLDHILQKTIDYQNQSDTSWRKSALLPMSFTGPGDDGAVFAEAMWDDFLRQAGYSRWRMYQQHGRCGSASIYSCDEDLTGDWKGSRVVLDRWLANDYGIVAWTAHGGAHCAGVGWDDEPNEIWCGEGCFLRSEWTHDLDDDHPAFTYQSGCATGYPVESNNLQYYILRHGGIATVAASRFCFLGPYDPGEFGQSDGSAAIGYEYLHRVVNGYTASEALYHAKFLTKPYADRPSGLWNLLIFNLYGDPTVRITDGSTSGQSRLTIPAAAFKPYSEAYDYENHGRFLINKLEPSGYYVAQVHLPHGAQVTRMTFRWHDGTQTAPAHALLHLTEYGKGNSLEMAYATTRVGGAGDGSSHDDTIAYATIDNAKYGYWALFHLPPAADARAYNIVLEYIPPTATTGRLSIPAAAFVPFSDNYQYENLGRRLTYLGGPARAHFEAPVHLPQGAQVTKVTFHFNDDSTAANGYARLCRTDLAGNYLDMAYIDSYYAWGYAGRSDTSIESPVVDNSQYAYWVYWDLPISTGTGNNVWGCGVVIEYDAPVATMSRGYIAIPAAAFTPFADDHHYENHGRYLIHRSGEAGAHYEAPVPLPQGATVTKVSFYYKHDEETWVTGHGRLCRTDLVGNYSDMAYIPTMQSFGFGSGHDYDIVSPGVDNARYVYWAYMDLPSSTGTDGAWGSGMIIEYEYAMCYLPMILSGQ